MQIRNVINENDYEFSISSFTSSLKSLNQQASPKSTISTTSTISNSSSSSVGSNRESLQQHNQQLDVQRICALVFSIYQKLCLTSIENGQQSNISISRQSIKESMIPGLLNLKDIFQNNIIPSSYSNNHNEFISQLDHMMNRLENSHFTKESTPSPNTNNLYINNSNSQIFTPVTTHEQTAKLTVNSGSNAVLTESNILNAASTTSLSSINNAISGSLNVGAVSQNGTTDNSNFKSFVFKGINNFKDHSKDKLSIFLLTNKTFKK